MDSTIYLPLENGNLILTKNFRCMIPNRGKFTKRAFGIGFYIKRYTEYCIRFLILILFFIPIHPETPKEYMQEYIHLKNTLKTSKNHSKICHILKCDIRKFLILLIILFYLTLYPKNNGQKSFVTHKANYMLFEKQWKGLPLGNVTSQLFSNIYLNELDQYVKHNLGRGVMFVIVTILLLCLIQDIF